MSEIYAGAALDGLLEILLEQRGDRLRLETDKKPIALRGESALRLTVPETSNSMLGALCGAMATRFIQSEHQSDSAHFDYVSAKVGASTSRSTVRCPTGARHGSWSPASSSTSRTWYPPPAPCPLLASSPAGPATGSQRARL